MGVKLEIWGDYASFNRPELKVERYSYDVITPSAARNILQAIYWHPGLNWVIDRILLLSEPERMSITRNEMKNKGSYADMKASVYTGKAPPHLKIDQTQRSASVLKNVHYVIEAHFIPSGNGDFDENKIYAIFCDRAKRGKCFKMPYLGCREFPANYRLVDATEKIAPLPINRDFGIMLYDIDYDKDNMSPCYFHAKANEGIIDLTNCEVIR